MNCPKCGVEAIISGNRVETAGESGTWTVLDYVCRNPRCQSKGKKIGESRHRQSPEEGGAENGEQR